MTRPLIAVIGRRATSVSCLRFAGTAAADAMCEAVYENGGEPVVLHSTQEGVKQLADRLARFSGVIVPGGGDVAPARYGQQPSPHVEPADELQDDIDFAVIRTVLQSGQPTLAICRAMQVLNAACGGTLIQHLTDTTVAHRNAIHDVELVRGSRLRAITGQDALSVSSYHHQAIDILGRGLRVTARAADKTIEAVEHNFADILAVQWHPEDLASHYPPDAALFADLIERSQVRDGITV